MKRLLFLVFIFCLPIFINCRFEDRIINGEETPLGKFMFLPRLFMGHTYIDWDGAPHTVVRSGCSSTIISKRHILTAAHCVKLFGNPFNDSIPEESLLYPFYVDVRPIENDFLPYFVLTDLSKYGITSEVNIHKEFDFVKGYDIAIIEFPKGVDFNITPVTLAKDYVDNYSDVAIAAGYGHYIFNVTTQNVSDDRPPTLRHVNVRIRSLFDYFGTSEDDPSWKNLDSRRKTQLKNDKKNLICAGNSGRLPQRVDEGDSGGPLLFEKNGKIYQIGVSSFINMKNVYAPGCYSRISIHCDWIEKHTNGEAKCQEMYLKGPVTEAVSFK